MNCGEEIDVMLIAVFAWKMKKKKERKFGSGILLFFNVNIQASKINTSSSQPISFSTLSKLSENKLEKENVSLYVLYFSEAP